MGLKRGGLQIKQKNQGACVARNKGLEIASGEFIKFLDADDYLVKDILSLQVKKMKALNQSSITFGDLIQKFPDQEKTKKYQQPNLNKMTESLVITGILTSLLLTSLPLHRKSLLTNIGGFDPRFTNGQERNLHIRLAASGVKFIYSPDVIYYQRIHDGEDRISNQQATIDWQYQIEKRLITLKSISTLLDITDSINNAMAWIGYTN